MTNIWRQVTTPSLSLANAQRAVGYTLFAARRAPAAEAGEHPHPDHGYMAPDGRRERRAIHPHPLPLSHPVEYDRRARGAICPHANHNHGHIVRDGRREWRAIRTHPLAPLPSCRVRQAGEGSHLPSPRASLPAGKVCPTPLHHPRARPCDENASRASAVTPPSVVHRRDTTCPFVATGSFHRLSKFPRS